MSDNALRTPLGTALNSLALKRADDAIQITGKSLPASVVAVRGSIVTVRFELNNSPFTLPNVQVPLATCEYARPPIQPGCLGRVTPTDAYMGGISGLGGGTADLTQRANLATLVFEPIASVDWSPVDGNVFTVYGPLGVTLRDEASQCVFRLTPIGITISFADGSVISLGNGTNNITLTNMNLILTNGDVVADGVGLKSHVHSGVQTGSSDTGLPI